MRGNPLFWEYVRYHLFKLTYPKIRGNYSSRNRWYTSPVRHSLKIKGPISLPSRTAHYTLTF